VYRPGKLGAMQRCQGCGLGMSDGWVFDVGRLRQSIDAYLWDYVNGRTTDDEVTRRKADEAERAEWEKHRPRRSVWKADHPPPAHGPSVIEGTSRTVEQDQAELDEIAAL
jgi:hypothetical protein